MLAYYDLCLNWHKVEPHIDRPEVQAVLAHDFSLFIGAPFDPEEDLPANHDWSEWGKWRWGHVPGVSDYAPEYFDYTCCRACHWLVNFNPLLAMSAEPDCPWRIVTCAGHSTVWDGDNTVFDPTQMAMGIPAGDDFDHPLWEHLTPGEMMPVHKR